MNKIYTFSLLVAACVFWGVGFPIAKIGVAYIHPFTFAFLRFDIVFVLFIVIFRLSIIDLTKKLKKNFLILTLMSLTGIVLYGIFFLFALKLTKASDISLIAGANPIITAIVASIFIKERLTLFIGMGIILSFLGVTFIVSKGNFSVLFGAKFNLGDLLMLFATTMWAIYSVLTKKALSKLTVIEAVCLTSFLGAVYFLPLSILWGKLDRILAYPFRAWASVFYMAVFSTVFAFSAWYRGIQHIGPSKSSIFVNLVPVFGVLTSIMLLHEKLHMYEITGGILVIVGVILANKKHHLRVNK